MEWTTCMKKTHSPSSHLMVANHWFLQFIHYIASSVQSTDYEVGITHKSPML
jgi:hypothetical protein